GRGKPAEGTQEPPCRLRGGREYQQGPELLGIIPQLFLHELARLLHLPAIGPAERTDAVRDTRGIRGKTQPELTPYDAHALEGHAAHGGKAGQPSPILGRTLRRR